MIARLVARAEKSAIARAQRRLAPHTDPDERVLTVDICRGGKTVDELLARRGDKVHLVLTDKALYAVERGGSVSRLPITEITDMTPAAAPHTIAGDAARIVVLELGERGYLAFLPAGRRAVADFAPKLEQLLRDQH